MAGEKAKENKRLTARCAACDKEMSVELLTGKVSGEGRARRIDALCEPCLDKGWSADAPTPAALPEPTEAPAE